MKKHLLVSLVLASLSLSIILLNCSKENVITGPSNQMKDKFLAKEKIEKLDHNKDTIITLPKSNKTIVIAKDGLDKIQILDDYLSTHSVTEKSLPTLSKLPYLCQYTISYWELENQYKSVNGKYLGIWNNYVAFEKLYNIYGFRMIFVSGTTEQDLARAAGFKYDSMMVGLDTYNTAFSKIDLIHQNSKKAGFYYIDEPFEKDTWNTYQILSTEAYLYNNYYGEKLMLGSYKWPSYPYSWPVSYGDKYTAVLNSYGNEYIMCDEYRGTCAGGVDDYWTEFRNYYGTWNCIMNWVHIVINNGTGIQLCSGVNIGVANSWFDLLGDANENGVNRMWLYASGTGDENAIINFCNTAWKKAWLLRLDKHLVITYRCTDEDCYFSCSVYQAYYDSQQWVEY